MQEIKMASNSTPTSRLETHTPIVYCSTPAIRCATNATPAITTTPSRMTGSRLRNLAENLWERDDAESSDIRNTYNALLERERLYVKEGLDNFLEYEEMTKLRKKETLHKKWSAKVSQPIRAQIDNQMHSPSFKSYEKRRNKCYNDYLEHTNKKGHVFLDVIAPDEYYASALQDIKPLLLKAKTGRLRDPLLLQQRHRTCEDEISIRCQTGCGPLTDADVKGIGEPRDPLVPLGRKGIDSIEWLKEPLLSINSSDREASRRRMLGNSTHSVAQLSWPDVKATITPPDELRLQKRRRLPIEQALPTGNITKNTVFESTKPAILTI